MGGNSDLWSNNNNMHDGAYVLASSFPFNSFPPSPPPSSWSHLLFSGVAGEEKGLNFHHNFQVINNNACLSRVHNYNGIEGIKQEGSSCLYGHGSGEEFQGTCSSAANNYWSQLHMVVPDSSSSPSSSSFTSCSDHNNINNHRLDSFSYNNKKPGITKKIHHLPPPDISSECSTTNGGICKKARVQASSSQPPLKVRKEKLGDRISAIHQLVSPFGKTDTASVLFEAIGYIRFLHGQIEALCFPYFGNPSKNLRNKNFVTHGERNAVFPEDPGQLLNNDSSLKRNEAPNEENEEEKKRDLRSKGLCLVPMSLSHHFGGDHNIYYWS